MIVCGPWILHLLIGFTQDLFNGIPGDHARGRSLHPLPDPAQLLDRRPGLPPGRRRFCSRCRSSATRRRRSGCGSWRRSPSPSASIRCCRRAGRRTSIGRRRLDFRNLHRERAADRPGDRLSSAAAVAFDGVMMAASLVAYQMGFGTASLFLPDYSEKMDAFSALHRMLVMLIFLTLRPAPDLLQRHRRHASRS